MFYVLISIFLIAQRELNKLLLLLVVVSGYQQHFVDICMPSFHALLAL